MAIASRNMHFFTRLAEVEATLARTAAFAMLMSTRLSAAGMDDGRKSIFWVHMMTGEGVRNRYPHSRFVGLIPGGIMNGIDGNASGEPIHDLEYGLDWRMCEYCSPHVSF